MPKIKTHKGASARFKYSGGGKPLRMKGLASHFRRRRSKRAKRQFDDTLPVAKPDQARLKRLIPYG